MYLIRKRALGDVLWIEPVIRVLACEKRKLVVVTRYNDLFLNYPAKNVRFKASLTIWEKMLVRADRLLGTRFFSIDLDGVYETTPHRHFLEAYQEKAGTELKRDYPRLYLSPQEEALSTGISGPFVVLHLESMTDKNYRKVYGVNWATISASLKAQGYTVLQLGQHPEPIPGVVHRSTTLREMIALLKKASFFIGLDSGPSHIAAALEIPSLIFFGAVTPAFRHFPELMKGAILQQPCPYAGCYHDAPNPETMVCRLVGPEGTPICSLHTTEGVLEAIKDLRLKYIC